jgi:predicted nucleotidyltransferase
MVAMASIQELVSRIAQSFDPQKVILFGSHATGQARDDSDVDLLVIMPLSRPSFWQSLDMLNALRPEFPVDLLARDPEDVAMRYRCFDPLIRDALDHGKVLYESRC